MNIKLNIANYLYKNFAPKNASQSLIEVFFRAKQI